MGGCVSAREARFSLCSSQFACMSSLYTSYILAVNSVALFTSRNFIVKIYIYDSLWGKYTRSFTIENTTEMRHAQKTVHEFHLQRWFLFLQIIIFSPLL